MYFLYNIINIIIDIQILINFIIVLYLQLNVK